MKKYPLYTVWHGILVRVGVRPNAKDHEIRDYINQGISVCKEWLSYENFHSWAMNNGYQKGLAIDRIDVNKGYSPENCRFVTVKENQRNRRCNIWCDYKGRRMLLIRAYEISGSSVPYKSVICRVKRDRWTIEDALTIPMRGKRKHERQTIPSFSQEKPAMWHNKNPI